MEALRRGAVARSYWFALPLLCLALIAALCVRQELVSPLRVFQQDATLNNEVLRHFHAVYLKALVLCGISVAAWLYVWSRKPLRPWLVVLFIGLVLAEYLSFALIMTPQRDAKLYYPERPMFAWLRNLSGRVLGMHTFPPNLLAMHDLRDIRGHDGIDSARMVEVLELVSDGKSKSLSHARLFRYAPSYGYDHFDQIRLPGVLNMLNVRWLIFCGSDKPIARPRFEDGDCGVFENVAALPRAYIPRKVLPAPGTHAALAYMRSPMFDPAENSYVDGPTVLADNAAGNAQVLNENPHRVEILATLERPGVVVLADAWFPGWRVEINGQPAELLRINHVLRGVAAPKGASRINFYYRPFSFSLGVWLSGIATLVLCICALWPQRHEIASHLRHHEASA
jgi:hypothetical protein